MKKIMLALFSSSLLLMTGCIETATSRTVPEDAAYGLTYAPQKHTVDLTHPIPTTWRQLQDTYNTASPTNRKEGDLFIQQTFGRENTATLTFDHWDFAEETYARLLEDPVIATLDDTILPGLANFIECVRGEQTSYAAKVAIINNAAISMYPMHLYNDNLKGYGYSDAMLKITQFYNEFTDPLWKSIAEDVDAESFVTITPVQGARYDLLQFATPTFIQNLESTITNKEGTNLYYKPQNALNYQLYTTDTDLEKIRLIIRRSAADTIDDAYFNPVRNWANEQWQFDTKALTDLERLVDTLHTGLPKKSKGTLGGVTYEIDLQKATTGYDVGNDSDTYHIALTLTK